MRRAGRSTPRAPPRRRGPRGTAAGRPRVKSEHAHDSRRQRQDDVRFLRLAAVVREQPADERHVAQPGTPSSTRRSLSRIRPASRFVSPSCRRITVLISRLPNVGQPAEAGPGNAADQDPQRQRHLAVVMRARRDVDVHADVLVVERRDRLLRDAAGGDGRERRDRHGTRSPNRACAGMPSDVRSCGLASVRVLLSALSSRIEQPRQVRQEDVGLREVAQSRAASRPRG